MAIVFKKIALNNWTEDVNSSSKILRKQQRYKKVVKTIPLNARKQYFR